jgi:EpsI family protein
MTRLLAWIPALLLAIGALVTVGADAQRTLPLRTPLETTVPTSFGSFVGHDLPISKEEQAMAGMTDYLMRVFTAGEEETEGVFSIYVGYYSRQTGGQTMHSPKNCLPGAGWEPLTSEVTQVATADGPVDVNRYLIQRGSERAMVIYWYQGRGRVQASEYMVKADLLLDAALKQRSDEALVRIIVPVTEGEDEAALFASSVAQSLIPAVHAALPG